MINDEKKGSKEIMWAFLIVALLIGGGAYAAYYFLAPPPALSLQEAADMRNREKEAFAQEETTAFQDAARTMKCGEGISGAICRMGQGACDTTLGGYFCVTEGRVNE